MTRHSKNNTAGAYFTSAEKEKLDYGTKRQRLGKDSMRLPDCCNICLQTASTPVVCDQGHLFCRECILQSILTQKQNISNLKKQLEEEKKRLLLETEKKEEDERLQKIEDFERQSTFQTGFKNKPTTNSQVPSEFWLPNKTPGISNKSKLTKVSLEIICPAQDEHSISVKKLFSVIWTKDKDGICICGPCGKELTSAAISGLLLFVKCGHVFCKKCIDSLNLTGGGNNEIDCPKCSSKHLMDKNIVNIKVDGTGFSDKGGPVLISKYSAPFS